MDVALLLAGKGTRLEDITRDIPKPMVDVNGRPFLYYLVEILRSYGLTDLVFICSWKWEAIKNYFGDGKKFGVNIRYSIQDAPYGTGGNLVTALDEINGEEFMLLNGDTIFNIDLNSFLDNHRKRGAKHSIALKKVPGADRSGVVKIDGKNKITNFSEKIKTAGDALINGGVYILNKKDFEGYEKKKFLSLETDVFPKISLHGFETQGKFIDIGTPEAYKDFCDNTSEYLGGKNDN